MTSASPEKPPPGRDDASRAIPGTAYGPADVRDTPHVSMSYSTGDPVPEQEDPWIGKTLSGVYEVIDKIGEGGMGAVYHARHVHLKKSFAIKVLAESIQGKKNAVERLKQEAMAAANIEQENIVDVVNFDEADDGAVFIVMELLKGESLSDTIGRGPVPLHRALPIAHQICRALHAAHEHGIVHRDLKPENVFLSRKGERTLVKVLDFGISKVKRADAEEVRMTKTGQLVGTPLYMSPEQARGESEIDRRVDVYALGVILYEMLCGAPPFEGRNYFELLWKHGNEPPPSMKETNPNAYIPDGVDAVVRRALAKDREHRHQTMAELELALIAAAPEVEAPASLPSLPPEGPRPPVATRASTAREPATSAPGPAPGSEPPLGHARTVALESGDDEADASPVPVRGPRPLLAVGLGVALVIGAVVAYAVSRGEPGARDSREAAADTSGVAAPPPEPDPAEAPEAPVAEADPEPPPAGVDPPAPVSVSLTSTPSGAEVRVGERVLGRTPLVAPLAVSDEAVELTFHKPGYLSQSLSVVPGPGLQVPEVRLRRRRRAGTGSAGGAPLPIKTGM